MAKKLASKGFAPTADLRVEGATLVGTLVSKRDQTTQFGNRPVYAIKVADATCKFMQGDTEVFPPKDTVVEFFAPTMLEGLLADVVLPAKVRIVNTGLGTKKPGRKAPYLFDAFLED